MLRQLWRRLFARRRHDDSTYLSGVPRDRLLTHPSDKEYGDSRASNEAFDAGVRSAGGPPGGH